MKLPQAPLLPVLAALITNALALPSIRVEERATTLNLVLCSGAGWTGKCVTYEAPSYAFNTCYDISATFPPGTGGGVDSAVANDGSNCILYPNNDCTGGNPNTGGELWVGEYEDMSDPDTAFSDVAGSFQCRVADQGSWDGWTGPGRT